MLNKNNEIVEIAHLNDYEAKTKNLAYKFNKTNLRFEKSVCSNLTEVDTVKLILPNSECNLDKNKIICASWIGRFGNRCHSYLYGKHIEDKFGHKFYVGKIRRVQFI